MCVKLHPNPFSRFCLATWFDKYQTRGCNMSIRLHFSESHLNFSLTILVTLVKNKKINLIKGLKQWNQDTKVDGMWIRWGIIVGQWNFISQTLSMKKSLLGIILWKNGKGIIQNNHDIISVIDIKYIYNVDLIYNSIFCTFMKK